MKIVLINGSPKVNTSASAILLEDLKGCFAGRAEVIEAGLHTPTVSEDTLQIIGNADAWVFACPLYVDGIPAHLLSCLVQLDEAGLQHHGMHVYGIVNCGFYEGMQAEPALKLLQNWCVKTGTVWGGGIGVGGGGSLFMLPGTETKRGPKAPVFRALAATADKILQRETQENQYVSVAIPRIMYKLAAQMGWRKAIKANGGTWKDLGNKPE